MRALIVAALVTLVPATALAQTPDRAECAQQPERAERKAQRRAARRAELIQRFDADGDGRLTGPERRQAKRAVALRRALRYLRRYDANHDGWVDQQEIDRGVTPARPAPERAPAAGE